MNLSLCMIVKDEAANLPHCLRSVQGLVTEIVVLDTGSQDHTREIARDWGARVYDWTWTQDFAAARNESLAKAGGEWVLVLDADEVLLPETFTPLRQVMQHPHYLVVSLVRQELGSAQAPYSLVSRLFRRHSGLYFSRPYHETIDDSVLQVQQQEPHWQSRYLPRPAIQHTGYQAQVITQGQKLWRGKAAMEKYLADHPRDPYLSSKLGALYLQLGEVKSGLRLLRRALAQPHLSPLLLYEVHYHLGIAYTHLRQYPKAEKHYQAAASQPVLPELTLGANNNWGSLRKEQGDLAGACRLYQRTLEIDPNFVLGYYNLGLVYKTLGNLSAALQHYHQAITLQPDYAEAHQNLGVVLFKLGRMTEGLESFRRAIALHEHQGAQGEAMHLRQGLQDMGFTV